MLPEDIERGFINHMLAVTWPQFRNQNRYFSATDAAFVISSADFFPPCSGGISEGSSWRQFGLACGQVLRLKKEGELRSHLNLPIDETVFSPITRMVLRAMRTFGVSPVRLGSSMTLLTESVVTGFLNVSFERAQQLAGEGTRLEKRKEMGLWSQLLRILAQQLAQIPLASEIRQSDSNSNRIRIRICM